MNLLQRALIEKAGEDNGFEHVIAAATEGWLALGSAQHPAELMVQATTDGFAAKLSCCHHSLPGEIARSFPEAAQAGGATDALSLLPTEAAARPLAAPHRRAGPGPA